jgi:hypothetical protein
MTATRHNKAPGNQKPNHESNSWLKSATSSEEPADGGSYIYNALAFSTLLSSQETDAHRWGTQQFLAGATLKPYSSVSSVSTSFFWMFPRRCRSRATDPPDTRAHPPQPRSPLQAHARPRMEGPDGSPGPGPPSGVPSPSGQDELYGWHAAQSNRGFYPAGIPVLTCPNQIWYWRDSVCLVMRHGSARRELPSRSGVGDGTADARSRSGGNGTRGSRKSAWRGLACETVDRLADMAVRGSAVEFGDCRGCRDCQGP